MPIAVVLDFAGATLEQYDRVNELMGLTQRGPGPPGALFHWATATETGIRVTDVWESREQFERFAGETIRPLAREVGFPESPQIAFHEVHNYYTAG